jgi:hypothetical protein
VSVLLTEIHQASAHGPHYEIEVAITIEVPRCGSSEGRNAREDSAVPLEAGAGTGAVIPEKGESLQL